MQYSKTVFLKNLAYLIVKKQIKTGELEERIGVSVGYFSRLKKNEDESASLAVDKLCALTVELNCSLDSLLFGDMASLSSTEQYVLTALRSIFIKTNRDFFFWEPADLSEFANKALPFVRQEFNIYGLLETVYYSFSLKSSIPCVRDSFQMSYSNQFYYFVSFSDGDDDCFELLLLTEKRVSVICFARKGEKEQLFNAMKSLHDSIVVSSKRVRLDPETKEALDTIISACEEGDDNDY